MNTRLFMGSLPWEMGDASLKNLVENGDNGEEIKGCGAGSVLEVSVIRYPDTQKSRGFAFVTMNSVENAQKAIQNLNGKRYKSRELKVDTAAEKSNARRSPSRSDSRGPRSDRSPDRYRDRDRY